MLTIDIQTLGPLEHLYPGIGEDIHRYEDAVLPACSICGSENSAIVASGLIGRTINVAGATTKFKVIPNGTGSGKYFCHACNALFDPTPKS